MADQVTIRHPKTSNAGQNAVPATFVAAGTAKGNNLKSVRGQVQLLAQTDQPIKGKLIAFIDKPIQSDRYRWLLYFEASAKPGYYKLDVFGLDVNGQDIQNCDDSCPIFEVGPAHKGPMISYPPNNYVITGDEKDYFVAYGSESSPIWQALIDAQAADYTYDDLSSAFWCAQFSALANGQNRTLRVVDYLSAADTRYVTVS